MTAAKESLLSAREREQALTHIKRCDNLFDGRREDGTLSTLPPDKEYAYNQMRLLALELIEKLDG